MLPLQNKLFLVSGGGRDIGRAIVVELARAGANVAFTTKASSPDAALAACKGLAGRAWAAALDGTNSADTQRFVEAATKHFGTPVHGVVNNAGGLVARKKLAELDEAFFDQVMALNLKSTYLFTKHGVAAMEDGGTVVNVSSAAARDGGGAGAIAYATAKGGIATFTKALAKDLGARRIRVNAVLPGMIDTTFHDTFTRPEVRKNVANATPLGREGTAAEVATVVAFLASPAASFMNGALLDINGGLVLA